MTAPVYPMTHIAPTIAAILDVPPPAQSTGQPIAQVVAELGDCDRLAVLAPDALGMYPWGLWRDKMPFLTSLINDRHVVLRAVMPTITPVNFATMITGGDQSVHGIETKEGDFRCETIFEVLATHDKQGAAVGQKGCTMNDLIARWAHIGRTAPRYEDDQVVDMLLEVAVRDTPEFLITQLVTTDDIFHEFRPSSELVVPYLTEVDARLDRLVVDLTDLGYGIIILADHGQHDADGRGTHGTEADEDALVPCTWTR